MNPVVVALDLNAKLKSLPMPSHGTLADQVGLSRGRICQYLRLLKLPTEVIDYMVDPGNQHVAQYITEQALHDLLKLHYQKIYTTFRDLVERPPA